MSDRLPRIPLFGSGPSLARSTNFAKSWFFDRAAVMDRLAAAKLKILSRFGAYVYTRARRSMRKRNKPSAPGQPPSAHENPLIRDLMEFRFDPDAGNGSGGVLIGPLLTNGGRVSPTVPELHENGSVIDGVLQWLVPASRDNRGRFLKAGSEIWESIDEATARRFPNRRTRRGKVVYPARPFMAPALAAERPRFAGLFKDSLGG